MNPINAAQMRGEGDSWTPSLPPVDHEVPEVEVTPEDEGTPVDDEDT